MTLKARGTFTVVGSKGSVEIPYNRMWKKTLAKDRVVHFALHVHPMDGKTLVLSEMSTGYDTGLRVMNRMTGKPHTTDTVRKMSDRDVGRMAQSALHAGLAKIGFERVLKAIEEATHAVS